LAGHADIEGGHVPGAALRKVQTRMNAATRDTDLLTQDREFTFSTKDFERVRTLIYQHAGIHLHEGKQAMVYSRLSRRLRDTNHTSFDSYLKWLESSTGDNGAREWQEFVNSLTTNLTSFSVKNITSRCSPSGSRKRLASPCASGAARHRPVKSPIPLP
jgi:hypothetical protein